MRLGFAIRLAYREGRHGIRRIGVYMVSITLGVGALVSIHSFRTDVERSVREQAEELMGANARLSGQNPPPDSVVSILDSLRVEGVGVARVTTATSMVLAPSNGRVRLLQVQAVDAGYPFYGVPRTTPAGMWGRQLEPGRLLVDPAVLTQLGVQLGDTLTVGRARLEVVAVVHDVPTDLAMQTAIGPRVYVSQATLERADLLGFGSLARYQVFLRLPEANDRRALRERYEERFQAARLSYTLAEEQARRFSNSVRFLGRFLALVGLGALLLGGVGVASAIHVYVREKRPGIAVLRCLGAGQSTAFAAYLIQAAGLGLIGAAAGVVLGLGLQLALPLALAGVLPVGVSTRVSLPSALAGMGIGVWVAMVFALIPLLEARNVPPLQALRSDFEPPRRSFDPARWAAWAALAASVVALCVIEAPEPELGLGFAVALATGLALLAVVARGFAVLTRRVFPARASYPVRQGLSNLFRPRNQTLAVTLAMGFGAFVIGTVVEVERNVRDDLTLSFGEGRPNVLLFDVQSDQVAGVLELLPEAARFSAEATPLVTSRIAAINGRTPEELRADSSREDRPEGWALRREYRNTQRAELGRAETLVAGRWWDDTSGREVQRVGRTNGLPGVSLEVDIAESLRVGLGDTITWRVSGIEIGSVVTSLREVDWGRLEPNFFAVLEPGALDEAPQTVILVARLPEPEARAAFQRDLVDAFPNVSALDFSRVQQAIDAVLSRARQAVGFLAGFSALAGLVVLVGALASSRAQRLKEAALLRTLGARRDQVVTVLLTELVALATLAAGSGLLLALAASWLLVPLVFEIDFTPHVYPLLTIWLAITALTALVGFTGSRGLLSRPPLPVLREAPE